MQDVVVIGCGVAGIAAMSRLYRGGFKVIGLEACHRIGGRVHSVQVENGIIDLGAEWCHGETGNIVYEMATKHLKRPDNFNVKFISSSGSLETSQVASDFVSIYYRVHDMAAAEMVESKEPLGPHCIKAYWKLLSQEYPHSDMEVNKQILNWFHQFENSINASDTWYDASGRGHLEYHDCEGELLLHWNGKGFHTILDLLMSDPNSPGGVLPLDIKLNKEVVRVDYSSGSSVVVECSDGTQYRAKCAIVTMSLGVLKERHIGMFHPNLPPTKVNSINGLELGVVDKLFLVYDKPWWGNEQAWYGLLWRLQEKQVFLPWWLHHVFAFNTCEHNPHVLCGWVTGKAAKYVELLDDQEVLQGLHTLLQNFFGKLFHVPPPLKMLRSKWYSNKYFRGSYSFRSMESDGMNAWAEQLAAPVNSPDGNVALCFAGEATSTHYFSTVHGALESGFREADRIIATVQTETPPRSKV